MKRTFSLINVASLTPDEWRLQQPFYKTLAKRGYFTFGLPHTSFYDAFYKALDHPLPPGADPHYHLSSYPLYLKEITPALFFQENGVELQILMVYVTYTGLWAVIWEILIQLARQYGFKRLSLMDRSFYGDPWTHYGFSGSNHDIKRELYI